jgi:tetratricopeptide (TPR) repeat protein
MNATMSVSRHWQLREWVIIISVIATFLAIISDAYSSTVLGQLAGWQQYVGQGLRILLVVVPITGSVVLALSNKFQEGERWLALRTGAEDVLRVIYLYRTILVGNPNRDQWLEERLTDIRRDALQKVKGNLALKPYAGKLPALSGVGDEGFGDLSAEDYISKRLNFQINQYTQKINDVQRIRTRLQIAIFALGGVGSLLAALSNMTGFNGLSIWVAFSTALAAAIGSWLELRQLDWRVLRGMSSEDRQKLYVLNTEKTSGQNGMDDPLESTVAIYSHIINELSIAHDHWISLNLVSESQKTSEFNELVLIVERVLWGKDFSLDQKANVSNNAEGAEPVQTDPKDLAVSAVQIEKTQPQLLQEILRSKGQSARQLRSKVVVLMPWGRRVTLDGQKIDFDHIFSALIEPSLIKAGFAVYRWSEGSATDSLQALLLADIVIADISVDDADVFYNLGLRHANRKQGIIHIREAQALSSFGTFNLQSTVYHCNKYGRMESSFQKEDTNAIVNAISSVWLAGTGVVNSPMFNLFTGLLEPDRKTLITPRALGFWQEYKIWTERMSLAQRQRKVGDILLLTDEIGNPQVKEEAVSQIGKAFANMGRYELALDQYRKGLEVNSRNLEFRRQEAFLLNRLGRVDEAIGKLEAIITDHPDDSEAFAYMGRIYKEMWLDSWKYVDGLEKRTQAAYASYHWLNKAIDSYMKGYRIDLNNYYPGVNALTLSVILSELDSKSREGEDRAPDIKEVVDNRDELQGTLTFALSSRIDEDDADYWLLVSMAELKVLTSKNVSEVVSAYRKAISTSRRNVFYLKASMTQLEMLRNIDIRTEYVDAGFRVLQDELRRITREEGEEESAKLGVKKSSDAARKGEGNVFVFSGYMVANPAKATRQFLPEKEKDIKQAIQQSLEKYKAGAGDFAVVAGLSAGSEILFAECCVALGIPVLLYLPELSSAYIRNFVLPAGDAWVERYYKLINDPLTRDLYQPDQVGLPLEGDNIYERNCRWALYSAFERGIDKVRLIALWNGKKEDVQDLDVHLVNYMVDLVRDAGCTIEQINPNKIASRIDDAAESEKDR